MFGNDADNPVVRNVPIGFPGETPTRWTGELAKDNSSGYQRHVRVVCAAP